jgi:hypothetical protein
MKGFIKVLAVAVMVLGANEAFAQQQSQATANVSATIVTPIVISNGDDMNFGNIAVSNTAGTVVLAPNGSRTSTGGVTLPVSTGTVTPATFNVTGQANYQYTITLPSGTITLNGPSSATMTVGTFTSTPSGSSTLSAGGTDAIAVGATLSVGVNQAPGVYNAASEFPVIVQYN